jgi:hypothetical protein
MLLASRIRNVTGMTQMPDHLTVRAVIASAASCGPPLGCVSQPTELAAPKPDFTLGLKRHADVGRGGVMATGGLEESAQRHLTLGNVNLDARTVAIALPVLLVNVVGALHPACNGHETCITCLPSRAGSRGVR